MTTLRSNLIEIAKARADYLELISEVSEDQGRLRVILALDKPAFDYRKAIESWMFDTVVDAITKLSITALPEFRGIDRPSLNRALETGIDVSPTNAHWYGGPLDKALEYGGDYPAVLLLDSRQIERTFRDLSIEAPALEHEIARAWAVGDPIPSGNGQYLRYSRLPLNDRGRGTAYETSYAWYIPGDPKEALLGYILCEPAKKQV